MTLCRDCPNVPIVSYPAGLAVCARLLMLSGKQRAAVIDASVDWLTHKHDGLELYEGIAGRPYTDAEKDLIGVEAPVVASLLCPYVVGNDCLIGGLGVGFTAEREAGHLQYFWLPTFIVRHFRRPLLAALVELKRIADAKIAALTRNRELDQRHRRADVVLSANDRLYEGKKALPPEQEARERLGGLYGST